MEEELRHEGIVDSIDGDVVRVRILQASACGGCQVKSLCKVSESKEKLIEVTDAVAAGRLAVGQSVNVAGTVGQGMRAVMLAFTLPLLLMLAAVITGYALGASDGVAAIVALAVLVPYYALLFLMRNRIGRKFRFSIID